MSRASSHPDAALWPIASARGLAFVAALALVPLSSGCLEAEVPSEEFWYQSPEEKKAADEDAAAKDGGVEDDTAAPIADVFDSVEVGPDAAQPGDAGAVDAGLPLDSGADATGQTGADTSAADGGAGDAEPQDSGVTDVVLVDAGPKDAGPTDAGPTDAGPTDAGPTDAGPTDAGPKDAGPADSGPLDAGAPDVAPQDSGPPDAAEPDAGAQEEDTPSADIPPPLCTGAEDCDDADPCTSDSCDPAKGCLHAPVSGEGCDDGNACTQGEACKEGKCVGGAPTDCGNPGPCKDVACNPKTGKCDASPKKDGSVCDDKNACTAATVCKAGVCEGTVQSCDDNNPCTNDGCDKDKGCNHNPSTAPCDDNNKCTDKDTCSGGACVGTKIDIAKQCDDADACTSEACEAKIGCHNPPNTALCDDGNPCTQGDQCANGKCGPGQNVCGCQADADCGPKEDGNLCNGTLFCDKSAAPYQCKVKPSTIITCSQSGAGPCEQRICEPATGGCALVAANEGKSCDADGSVCTQGDVCKGGTCQPGTSVICDDKNPCTDDKCDPKAGCVFTPNTAPCDDGDKCTTSDACKDKLCVGGAPPNCDDGNICTEDTCTKTVGCSHADKVGACSDGNLCTLSDHCKSGKCVAGTPKVCPASGTTCQKVQCSSVTGACHRLYDNEGKSCNKYGVCAAGYCLDVQTKTMAVIPEGAHYQGCNEAADTNCGSAEKPQHYVILSPYLIDLREVTVDEYHACTKFSSKPCPKPTTCGTDPFQYNYGQAGRGKHPMNCVAHGEAAAYCAAVGKRLPTEAEWERAARGGCEFFGMDCKKATPIYAWGNATATCDRAVMKDSKGDGCGQKTTWPVGTHKDRSTYGLWDMTGNLTELVADVLGDYPTGPIKDPKGPASGSKFVKKGGNFMSDYLGLRLSRRSWSSNTYHHVTYGFRCARNP